jgi:hypothetical protein
MATAVSTKPTPHPPKMKRPPPPFVQPGVSGARGAQPGQASSPALNRPGGGKQSAMASSSGPLANGANGRAASRPKKETQKPGEPSSRLQRPSARVTSLDDRRAVKKFPEPYGKSSCYHLGQANRLHSVFYSQNYAIYPQEIQQTTSITHYPPPSNSLSIRPTRWQFPVYVRDEGHPRAHQGRNRTS